MQPLYEKALITGGEDHLLPHLIGPLSKAVRLDVAVAFVLEGGLELLEEHLVDLVARGGRLRLLTGDYFDISEPSALRRLLDLRARFATNIELRIFECRETSFHAKSYIAHFEGRDGVAFVGSSNLSKSALTQGVEWNYRTVPARDAQGFFSVAQGFEDLFQHPSTRPLDEAWVRQYEATRNSKSASKHQAVEHPPSEVEPPPQPHVVQAQALAALENTRERGNEAGLVVMATGLGKTWLAAFDTDRPDYQRVLFVAHREEILEQALKTFRRIRPRASLGFYTGKQKDDEASVLFASIQTLSRATHLREFKADSFDYIIIDEFHHAAAATYRRLIGHFTPRFLLGLTATPERTDGGDLLALCQENLVYRSDVAEGIEYGLLCPFHYFGVPDDVDYSTIPWRSSRFDEEALTTAVATKRRAQNALEQYQEHAGKRTLSFCCSVRHADFMAEYFRSSGLRALAVHSGRSSAPRALSLEQLRDGDVDVLFTVDMFNEGVDVPSVDTVLMLRPTESRIVWLQQFGRGLRVDEGSGKSHLVVVDYIGNHKSFLQKPIALLGLDGSPASLRAEFDRIAACEVELPPGCEVTYELEAINILRSLLPEVRDSDALLTYYEEFRSRHGSRPRAVEAYHDNYHPRMAKRQYGSWLGFVEHMGDLSEEERAALNGEHWRNFLEHLHITPMTKSFKMLVLLGMLDGNQIPGEMRIEDLIIAVRRQVMRSELLRQDFGESLGDVQRLETLLKDNPIAAWTGGRGTGGKIFFEYTNRIFRTRFSVPKELRLALQEHIREIAEWRIAEYLDRDAVQRQNLESFTCDVIKSSGHPVLRLPDRRSVEGIPSGDVVVLAGGREITATFGSTSVRMDRRPGEDGNVFASILEEWFGADCELAGRPCRIHFKRLGDDWEMSPLGQGSRESGFIVGKSYMRSEVPPLLGEEFSPSRWNQGFIALPSALVLLVTLDKGDMAAEHQYHDRFLSQEQFEWLSQNRTTQSSNHGRLLSGKKTPVHLFVRKRKRNQSGAAPFFYCGELEFERWQGERPITIWWRLKSKLSDSLWKLFKESQP